VQAGGVGQARAVLEALPCALVIAGAQRGDRDQRRGVAVAVGRGPREVGVLRDALVVDDDDPPRNRGSIAKSRSLLRRLHRDGTTCDVQDRTDRGRR
jgi:hypothetical protein